MAGGLQVSDMCWSSSNPRSSTNAPSPNRIKTGDAGKSHSTISMFDKGPATASSIFTSCQVYLERVRAFFLCTSNTIRHDAVGHPWCPNSVASRNTAAQVLSPRTASFPDLTTCSSSSTLSMDCSSLRTTFPCCIFV